MPWWIWLILVLFMVVMLVVGLIYLGVHGMRAVRKAGKVGAAIGERISAMTERDTEQSTDEPPLFTQPLQEAARRYSDAHAQVIARKNAKRERHARQWARWS